MIGDAVRIQNTAFDASLLFADPDDGASASRSVPLLSRAANIWLGTHYESWVFCVDVSRSYWFVCRSWNYCKWPGKSLSLSLSRTLPEFGLESISWFPRVSRTCAVHLSNCVSDVSSRSYRTRHSAVCRWKEPEEHRAELDLHDLHVCMILNPLDRMSDTTESTTGADKCDQFLESLKFASTELEPRPRVFTVLCTFQAVGKIFFFHSWLCTLSLTEYQESPLPVRRTDVTDSF